MGKSEKNILPEHGPKFEGVDPLTAGETTHGESVKDASRKFREERQSTVGSSDKFAGRNFNMNPDEPRKEVKKVEKPAKTEKTEEAPAEDSQTEEAPSEAAETTTDSDSKKSSKAKTDSK